MLKNKTVKYCLLIEHTFTVSKIKPITHTSQKCYTYRLNISLKVC